MVVQITADSNEMADILTSIMFFTQIAVLLFGIAVFAWGFISLRDMRRKHTNIYKAPKNRKW